MWILYELGESDPRGGSRIIRQVRGEDKPEYDEAFMGGLYVDEAVNRPLCRELMERGSELYRVVGGALWDDEGPLAVVTDEQKSLLDGLVALEQRFEAEGVSITREEVANWLENLRLASQTGGMLRYNEKLALLLIKAFAALLRRIE